jgi:ATP-dependent DNA helicase RecG
MLDTPEITISAVAEKLGRSERAIELQINKLKESQVMTRVGPANGGHWQVAE